MSPANLESFGNADCLSGDSRRMQAILPGREAEGIWAGQSQHSREVCVPGVQAGRRSPRRRLTQRNIKSPVLICSFLFGALCVRCRAALAAESHALGYNLRWGNPEHPPGMSRHRSGCWAEPLPGTIGILGPSAIGAPAQAGGIPKGTAATKYPKAGESCWGLASPSDRLI